MRDLYKRLGVSMTEGVERIRNMLPSIRDEAVRRDCERILLDPEARGVYDRNLRLLRQIAEARNALGIVETDHWSRRIQDELVAESQVASNGGAVASKSTSLGCAMWLIGSAGIVILFVCLSRTSETAHSRFVSSPGVVEQILQNEEEELQPLVRRTDPPVPETKSQVYAIHSSSISKPTIPALRIESLSAFRLKEERSKYDRSIQAGIPKITNFTDDVIHRLNWSYIKLLQGRQSKLPRSGGLYQAYTREIELVKFYASRPPYIVDIESISRENIAERLTPDRNSYAESVRSYGRSSDVSKNQEEIAAVTLILAAKNVIKEIQNRYSGGSIDRNALIEEFRILREVIPRDSANFKSLRSELELIQNEMLKSR